MVATERGLVPDDGDHTDLVLDQEDLRTQIVGVREVTLPPEGPLPEEDWQMLKKHLKLLKDESNIQHFVGIVKTIDDEGKKDYLTPQEFLEELRERGVHWMQALNGVGEVVGFAIIRDPGRGQNDPWIERIVIDNALQNKRDPKTPKVGGQFLERLKDYAFTTHTFDDRERTSLHASVVMEVANSSRAYNLFAHHGFTPIQTLSDQAEVIVRGRFETHHTERLLISRKQWLGERALEQIDLEDNVPPIVRRLINP